MNGFEGNGFLALWNGVDPSRTEEYNLWHAREHVPERLSVPGMCSARRYRRIAGPMHEYLTLYNVEDTGVFSAPAYRHLLDNPTPWSRSMRPSFRGFLRICCQGVQSAGGGLGGAAAAMVFDADVDAADPGLAAALASLLGAAPVTAVHLLVRDPSVPPVPFTIGGDADVFPQHGVVLIESFDADALSSGLPMLSAQLNSAGLSGGVETLTTYRLANAIDRQALPALVPFRREQAPASVATQELT